MKSWAATLLLFLPLAAAAQTLYVEGADPYSARRRFAPGDLIQVSIDENLTADRESQMAVNKQASVSAGASGSILGASGLSAQGNLAQSGSGSGSTRKTDQLLATLTVRVEKVLDNGGLQVKGERLLDLDGEEQKLTLSGVLMPEDVTLDRTALSSRLANGDLHLSSKGTAARGGTLGWLHWLLSWVGL